MHCEGFCLCFVPAHGRAGEDLPFFIFFFSLRSFLLALDHARLYRLIGKECKLLAFAETVLV